MEWYDGLYGFVRRVGREGCTRSGIAAYQNGRFIGRLDMCKQHGIIDIVSAKDPRDDRIILTPLGVKIFNHSITVKDLFKEENI